MCFVSPIITFFCVVIGLFVLQQGVYHSTGVDITSPIPRVSFAKQLLLVAQEGSHFEFEETYGMFAPRAPFTMFPNMAGSRLVMECHVNHGSTGPGAKLFGDCSSGSLHPGCILASLSQYGPPWESTWGLAEWNGKAEWTWKAWQRSFDSGVEIAKTWITAAHYQALAALDVMTPKLQDLLAPAPSSPHQGFLNARAHIRRATTTAVKFTICDIPEYYQMTLPYLQRAVDITRPLVAKASEKDFELETRTVTFQRNFVDRMFNTYPAHENLFLNMIFKAWYTMFLIGMFVMVVEIVPPTPQAFMAYGRKIDNMFLDMLVYMKTYQVRPDEPFMYVGEEGEDMVLEWGCLPDF